jgi:polysaccharide export outer membrane protein
LRRTGDPIERHISFADLAGENGSNTLLMPGDTLFVPPAEQFFVYGQVNAPGSFIVKPNMTLRQALARAGGPTLAGSEKKLTLYRDGKKIKKARLDLTVKADDVIYVEERIF